MMVESKPEFGGENPIELVEQATRRLTAARLEVGWIEKDPVDFWQEYERANSNDGESIGDQPDEVEVETYFDENGRQILAVSGGSELLMRSVKTENVTWSLEIDLKDMEQRQGIISIGGHDHELTPTNMIEIAFQLDAVAQRAEGRAS